MAKNLKRTLALAALMAGATGVANATEGWYGRADVGYSTDGSVLAIPVPVHMVDQFISHLRKVVWLDRSAVIG